MAISANKIVYKLLSDCQPVRLYLELAPDDISCKNNWSHSVTCLPPRSTDAIVPAVPAALVRHPGSGFRVQGSGLTV
jgi:hypothetical protein